MKYSIDIANTCVQNFKKIASVEVSRNLITLFYQNKQKRLKSMLKSIACISISHSW